MESQTYISCVAWIHRGYAAAIPKQIQLTQQQMEQIKADPMVAQSLNTEQPIDEEDDMPAFGDDVMEMANEGGPYPFAVQDLSDDQKEDYYIKQTDALIVAGKIQKQFASLQVYVYEQQRNNLYVHHQIMLSAFPLDIKWLRVNLGSINSNQPQKGNYAIVASFLPQIQIWNLDLTEAIQPDVVLGGQIVSQSKKPKKFTNKNKKYKANSHTDSVTTLSLNHANLGVLASGSVDNTMKVWDIVKEACVHTSSHHSAAVKKVDWSSVDMSVILTASEDKTIGVLDSRFPNDHIIHTSQQEIQSACWNINNQSQIAYATYSGTVCIFDVRKSNKVLATQQAHSKRINDIKIGKKNLCYTCSEDQTVRVWNLNNLSEPVAWKNPKCGILMCLDLLQDDAGPVLSAGNEKGELFVWDVTQNENMAAYWNSCQ